MRRPQEVPQDVAIPIELVDSVVHVQSRLSIEKFVLEWGSVHIVVHHTNPKCVFEVRERERVSQPLLHHYI
jgi:hypothetical protein